MKKIYLIFSFCAVFGACSIKQQAESDLKKSISEYSEPHRPQFHFSPDSNWLNDPNGMVYFNGEYHLFYQHTINQNVPDFGQMHWGHAISKDLVHWTHMPPAIKPDHLGAAFSGGAVLDHKNTSGLGSIENPPLIAFITSAGASQQISIAFSTDKGRTWEKYANNPVLPNPGIPDFRDPKVMWFNDTQTWIMSLAVGDHIAFYSSKNLLNWMYESDFGTGIGAHGGVWECPDLIKMKVEDTDEERWVLLVSINPGGPNGGSATQYFVGDFDGKKFVVDKEFEKQLVVEYPLPKGKVFADFEGSGYGKWKTEGDAFGKAPVKGTFPGQHKVNGYNGSGLVNSFLNGDATTGKLTSPEFVIESDYINLLVGGGNHPEGTKVDLLVDGRVVKTATGKNSELLSWVAWNTRELKGKKARIEIVDNEKGGWGHILVDHIIFSNEPAKDNKEGIWLDYGRDNYAGVTWSNVPEEDGRALFIGWMSNWAYSGVVPTEKWRSAMTIPRSLSLQKTAAGLRVLSKPVKELQKIYTSVRQFEPQIISDSLIINGNKGATFDLTLDLETIDHFTGFAIELSNSKNQKVLIGYDPARNEYYTDRREAGTHDFSNDFGSISWGTRISKGTGYHLQILADVASVEVFADGGKTVFTDIVFPDEPFTNIKLKVDQGQLKLKSGSLTDLRSIWIGVNL